MHERIHESPRPGILLVSPVFPDVTGFGLAMRAGALLTALAAHGSVHVLVVPIYDPGRKTLPETMRRFSSSCSVLPVSRAARAVAWVTGAARSISGMPVKLPGAHLVTARLLRRVERACGRAGCDYLYIFRLYMVPFMRDFLSRNDRHLKGRFLDIDDIESRTRSSLAARYRANGLPGAARREEQAAQRYAAWERELLPQFDGVSVCSPGDRHLLSRHLPAQNIHVLPNIVHRPAPLPPAKESGIFNLLFVGNLNYYPNQDALGFFFGEILPQLRSRAKQPVSLTVIGSGKWPGLKRFSNVADCHFAGFVPDVAPYYARADAVVAPLRAGGGTRIKILEAFSFQRPVITTTIGAEGLEIAHETHALIADSPADFAAQCCRIMEDRQLAAGLTAHATACLNQHYTIDTLRRNLGRMLAWPLPGTS